MYMQYLEPIYILVSSVPHNFKVLSNTFMSFHFVVINLEAQWIMFHDLVLVNDLCLEKTALDPSSLPL